ncbi:MAG TPA: amidohydrolase [Longimicrobiaceae bacterium]|jgi:predicted amidohydrolase YtcJ|nr:amidohydrolase [Longimicrobiaceae bacterium]
MNRTSLLAAGLAALAACAPTVGPTSAGEPSPRPALATYAADMVLRNGKIFLADDAGTIAQAVALRDGKVVAVGSDADVAPLVGLRTQVTDLGGRFVTPGFNDAHLHFAPGGASLLDVQLLGATSLDTIAARVKAAADSARPGEWIQGRGWDQTRLPASQLTAVGWPTREVLDRAAPHNPVLLGRVDGHTAWANAEALRLAGITRTTPNPSGGEIVRDPATGEATGILKESAAGLVERVVPAPSAAQVRRAVNAALDLAARTGVTSVQSEVDPTSLQVYREMEHQGSLTVRIYGWLPLTMESIRGFRTLGESAPFGDDWLRIGMLKGYTDGTLGSRTAYMLEPFSDDPSTRGLPQYRDSQLDSLVAAADAAGLQVILHAIGDAANRQALNAFERAARANGTSGRRHRIEHAQVLDRADIPRFRQLGVIASMQPTHATSDMRWVETRIGHERAVEGAYAWRSLLNAGARVIFGTDFAVEPMNPMEGIYSAVTRQSREAPGTPAGGWLPEQKLTRVEAIRLYTAAPAYGEFQEARKGTLQRGMLADLVVWDADLLTIPEADILKAHPWMTVVNGQVVYHQ